MNPIRTRCIAIAILLGTISIEICANDELALWQKIGKSMPHLTIHSIVQSQVPGIMEVQVEEKGAMFYVTSDGSHLIAGDLYSLAETGLVNQTEIRRKDRRRSLISDLAHDEAIAFAPRDDPKVTVYVFVDVDCPFCQRFHEEMPELNEYGIEVRYLAFPRNGSDSDTYERTVWTWCSDDRRTALTAALNGKEVPVVTCDHPVDEHIRIGRISHVEGTPTLITEHGERISGYLPAAELATRLGLRSVSDQDSSADH